MNVHEYQAKEVLRQYGVNTLRGKVSTSPEEARLAADTLGGDLWVIKAQVHAGGRGKGGGVKLARSRDEVYEISKQIIGMTLITHQTGPTGKKVHQVLIEEGCDILKEYYVAALIDRASSRITMIASAEGGVEIEEVASKHPEKIHREIIDPACGMQAYQARNLAFALNIPAQAINPAVKTFLNLYQAFEKSDCSLAEINPLVLTKDHRIIALDAKLNFDDNALFRHEDISEMWDPREDDPAEVEAAKYDLAFIKLDGNIGCLVNGAGLAMSTMDIIKLYGGEPANFLDVGGGATKEKVTSAFKIILTDPNVKAILVNIFGGIMKCDIVAEGIVAASRELGLKVPLVVRLAGTNVEKGKEILAKSGLNIIPAGDLADAAQKVVAALKEVSHVNPR